MRILVCLLALTACQGSTGDPAHAAGSAKASPATAPGVTAIEVRSGAQVVSRVVPGQPCRADIETVSMQIGGSPLVAQVGEIRWTGEDADNGTVLSRDGTAMARVFSRDARTDLSLLDPQGVAIIRAKVAARDFDVLDAAGRNIHHGSLSVDGIVVDQHRLVVTGTDDLLLAAILTSPEASPEIRGLAACHRLLASTGGAS